MFTLVISSASAKSITRKPSIMSKVFKHQKKKRCNVVTQLAASGRSRWETLNSCRQKTCFLTDFKWLKQQTAEISSSGRRVCRSYRQFPIRVYKNYVQNTGSYKIEFRYRHINTFEFIHFSTALVTFYISKPRKSSKS